MGWAPPSSFSPPRASHHFPYRPTQTFGSLCKAPRKVAERIERARADAIHIATEGTIGLMTRRWCLGHGYPFTTSFTTRFPEYIAARWPVPERLIYGVLRRFHAAATVTMRDLPTLLGGGA